MNERRLLAVDLSTIVLGYSIFNLETNELIKISYFNFKEEKLIDRAGELDEFIINLIKEYKITHFVIEENLKSFKSAGTNADAMLNTSKLNFLCQYLLLKDKMDVKEINVNKARSACFPKFHTLARAIKGVKHKEIAFDMVKKVLGEDIFPTKVLKSGPRKGKTVFLEEAKDMSDSWVLGKAFINLNLLHGSE